MSQKANLVERQVEIALVRMDQLRIEILKADSVLEEEFQADRLEDVKFQFDRVLRSLTKLQQTAMRKSKRGS